MMKKYMAESLFLLLSSKAFANISIAEITDKAGVHRATYYRNFTSKEEIIRFYLRGIMSNFLEKYEKNNGNSLETYLSGLFNHFFIYRTQLLLLYQNGLSYLLLDVFNDLFEERQSEKFHNPATQFHLFYHIGGIYNFFVLWLSHDMQETPEYLAQIAVSNFPADAKPLLL